MSNAMSKFKSREVEYNGVKSIEYQTAAKLVSIGKWNEKLINSNGKKYILNTIEVDVPTGVKRFTAMCYENNYRPESRKDFANGDDQPLKIGESYLTTLRFGEDGEPNLQMSHLTNANRATADDFAFLVRDEDGTLSLEKAEKAAIQGAPVEE